MSKSHCWFGRLSAHMPVDFDVFSLFPRHKPTCVVEAREWGANKDNPHTHYVFLFGEMLTQTPCRNALKSVADGIAKEAQPLLQGKLNVDRIYSLKKATWSDALLGYVCKEGSVRVLGTPPLGFESPEFYKKYYESMKRGDERSKDARSKKEKARADFLKQAYKESMKLGEPPRYEDKVRIMANLLFTWYEQNEFSRLPNAFQRTVIVEQAMCVSEPKGARQQFVTDVIRRMAL